MFVSGIVKFARISAFILSLCAILLVMLPVSPARAATNDLATCNASELIDAITAANSNPDASAITLNATCTGASAYTLDAVNNTDQGPNGLPVITNNLTIEGQGAWIVRSTAGSVTAFRLFQVNSTAMLTLNNVTLAGGDAGGGNGGALYTTGTLEINRSTLQNNTAEVGGAIYVTYPGALALTTSTLTQNSAVSYGGAITVFQAANSTITRSTFFQNTLGNGAFGGGLAVYNSTIVVANSTFFANNAGNGFGGGIGNEAGNLTLLNSTLVGNIVSGQFGGGFANQGNATVQNTIFANNAPQNCYTINNFDQGYNLDSGTTCGLNQTTSLNNSSPQLGALANNGGPTQTMALAPTSPAVDSAPSYVCNAQYVLGIDQRGVSRLQGMKCDMGAFEYVPPSLPAPCAPKLAAPKPLSPLNDSVQKKLPVSLDWRNNPCALEYEIRLVSNRNTRAQGILHDTVSTSHYTVSKLKRGHTYTWQVRACRNNQCGDWSKERRFTLNK